RPPPPPPSAASPTAPTGGSHSPRRARSTPPAPRPRAHEECERKRKAPAERTATGVARLVLDPRHGVGRLFQTRAEFLELRLQVLDQVVGRGIETLRPVLAQVLADIGRGRVAL